MNWFAARNAARKGSPIRRLGWADKWITTWRGLWWCHERDQTPRVVQATDFGADEFLATDWTTIAPEKAECTNNPPLPPPAPDDPVHDPDGPPGPSDPDAPNGPSPGGGGGGGGGGGNRPPRPPKKKHPGGFSIDCTAECAGAEIIVSCNATVTDALLGDRWMTTIKGPGTRSGGTGFIGPGDSVGGSWTLDKDTYAGRTVTYFAQFSELDHPGGSASQAVNLPDCEPVCLPYDCYESAEGSIGNCSASPYCSQTVFNPFPHAAVVSITGSVDDELLINGSAVDAGCCIYYICNGAHSVNHVFMLAGGASFTLAAGDNHGSGSGYALTICFDAYAPPP
jgi:hypothetical protein